MGPKSKLINKPDNKLNKLNKPTKTKSGGKSNNQASPLAKPSSKGTRGFGAKSLCDDSSSSSSASEDEAVNPRTSCHVSLM